MQTLYIYVNKDVRIRDIFRSQKGPENRKFGRHNSSLLPDAETPPPWFYMFK